MEKRENDIIEKHTVNHFAEFETKEQIKERIVNEDERAKKRFLWIMTGAFFFGIIFAFLLGIFHQIGDGKNMSEVITSVITSGAPIIMILVGLGGSIYTYYLYRSGKKLYETGNLEEDDIMEQIDRKLCLGAVLSSATLMFSLAMFGLTCYNMSNDISDRIFGGAVSRGIVIIISIVFFYHFDGCIGI